MHNEYLLKFGVVVLLGLGLGVGASSIDAIAGSTAQTDYWRAVSMLLNAGTTWAALAFLAGRLAKRLTYGVIAGFVSLGMAVIGYYAHGMIFGDRMDVATAILASITLQWLLVAVVVGPLLGAIGALSWRRGVIGVIASSSLATGAIVEMIFLQRLNGMTFKIDPWIAFTQIGMITVACAVTTLLIARSLRSMK